MVSEMRYTNWGQGEPNNFKDTSESCMHVYSVGDYGWNDFPCDRRMCSVCEIDIDPSVPKPKLFRLALKTAGTK